MDLVTGASGHLGNTLTRKLLRSGRKVRVFLRPSSDHRCLEGLDVEKSYGDLQDADSLMQACNNIDAVYHTAAEISIMPLCNKRLSRINLQGTENVIAACLKNHVAKLIYTSSIQALPDVVNGSLVDEKIGFGLHHKSAYRRTKAAASSRVLEAVDQGLNAVVLCPTGFIGPYDFKISLIGQFLIDYLQQKHRFIIDGAYDFVDTRDVAQAHMAAYKKGKLGQTYIISGHQVSMRQLVEMLSRLTKKRAPKYWLGHSLAGLTAYAATCYYWLSGKNPQFTPYSLETIRSNSRFSYKKAARDLEYAPRPFEQSLQDALCWYKELVNLDPADP